MSDVDDLKEVLPLAARACGYRITWGEKYNLGDTEVDCTDIAYVQSDSPDESPCYWNPLTPGDGAEMEDKLRISVMRSPDGKVWSHVGAYEHFAIEDPADHPDEGKARRWASLRVAAAIGRSMK
jgi:hypothetical protein